MTLRTTITRIGPLGGITAGAAAMAAILAALAISAGCDSAAFVPPLRPELSEPATAANDDAASSTATSSVPAAGKTASKRTRIVELILARPPDADRIVFDNMLRRELARVLVPLRLTQPDSQKPSSPEALAGAIRAAVDRGAAGLVVEPRDEAVVIDALHDAVGRGVAVLLLDRSVPARSGKSIPRVEYTGFADMGQQIVAAVLDADREQVHARPGRIVFLHHSTDDPYVPRSFKSLLGPCQAAGKPIEVLEFDGTDEQGMALLRKSVEANPDVDILLADDGVGVFVGFQIHIELTDSDRRAFVLAGYSSDDYRLVTVLDRMYAIGDRSVGLYASKTSQALQRLMEGKPVEDVVEVPVRFNRRWRIPEPPRLKKPIPGQDRKR
jgi:ABC-type sugar transport system substrate-binding protein